MTINIIDDTVETGVDKFMTPYDWIILSDNDVVSFVAPATLPDYYEKLNKSYGINYHCWDSDPKFKNNSKYTVSDVVFDSVILPGLIVNFNSHKMYPVGKLFRGEMILMGSDNCHNGDCNPVYTCEQLIEQNDIHTVYKMAIADHWGHEQFKYKTYMIWGRND
jgi:hypothetical protein